MASGGRKKRIISVEQFTRSRETGQELPRI